MKNTDIIVAALAVGSVVIVVWLAIFFYNNMMITNAENARIAVENERIAERNEYCSNWFAALEERRLQIENAGFWEDLTIDRGAYKDDVNAYNQECYY
jgi:hypothetical protein